MKKPCPNHEKNQAKNDANFIIDSNILGKTDRGKNLEILLHLFNKEEALKYLEAG